MRVVALGYYLEEDLDQHANETYGSVTAVVARVSSSFLPLMGCCSAPSGDGDDGEVGGGGGG